MLVKLSKNALQEIAHKISILVDEPELQDAYELTQGETEAMLDRFSKGAAGDYELSKKEAVVIEGELTNACDLFAGEPIVRAYRYVVNQIAKGGYQKPVKRTTSIAVTNIRRRHKKGGRLFPVNGVIEEKCPEVERIAKELIAAYEQRTRALNRTPVKINDRKIRYFAVTHGGSHAYYNIRGERLVTIGRHLGSMHKEGYLTYVIAHELAHHYAQFAHNFYGHGEMFMYWLKQLCPPEYVHYELSYKPKYARAAGIRKPEQMVA